MYPRTLLGVGFVYRGVLTQWVLQTVYRAMSKKVFVCFVLRLCFLLWWVWLWFAVTVLLLRIVWLLFGWLGLLLVVVAFGGFLSLFDVIPLLCYLVVLLGLFCC